MTAESLSGQQIKAADACYFPTGNPTLFLGRLYEIIDAVDNESYITVTVIDDNDVPHDFDMNYDGTFHEYECVETKSMQKPFYDLK
jgi:hypothetical protein